MAKERYNHDRFIKAVFSNIENAKSYFRHRLSPELSRKIDIESIRPVPGSFIDEKLQTSFADIVFEAPFLSSDKSVYLSIPIEFKSTKDKYVTIQMGHYILSGLWQQVRNKKEPRLILPILFYHGKEPWEYHTLKSLYKGLDEELLKYIPDFDYIYDNVQGTSDHDLIRTQARFWGAVKLLLKYAWDEDYLLTSVGRILMDIRDKEGNILKESFVYFFSLLKNKTKAMDAIDELIPRLLRGDARNAFEEILLEGLEKGMFEGRQEGRQEGTMETKCKVILNLHKCGVSIEKICIATELSEDEVRKILRVNGMI